MVNFKEGDLVALRDHSIRGPIRDRSSENSSWPWGESCPCCGQRMPSEMVWRPDGRAQTYNDNKYLDEEPHPHDIVSTWDYEFYLSMSPKE